MKDATIDWLASSAKRATLAWIANALAVRVDLEEIAKHARQAVVACVRKASSPVMAFVQSVVSLSIAKIVSATSQAVWSAKRDTISMKVSANSVLKLSQGVKDVHQPIHVSSVSVTIFM